MTSAPDKDFPKTTIGDAPHPSEFIGEELAARGWTRAELVRRMGGDALDLCAVDLYFDVGPGAPNMLIGAEMAEKLARAFDVSARFFLALETAWRAAYVKH